MLLEIIIEKLFTSMPSLDLKVEYEPDNREIHLIGQLWQEKAKTEFNRILTEIEKNGWEGYYVDKDQDKSFFRIHKTIT